MVKNQQCIFVILECSQCGNCTTAHQPTSWNVRSEGTTEQAATEFFDIGDPPAEPKLPSKKQRQRARKKDADKQFKDALFAEDEYHTSLEHNSGTSSPADEHPGAADMQSTDYIQATLSGSSEADVFNIQATDNSSQSFQDTDVADAESQGTEADVFNIQATLAGSSGVDVFNIQATDNTSQSFQATDGAEAESQGTEADVFNIQATLSGSSETDVFNIQATDNSSQSFHATDVAEAESRKEADVFNIQATDSSSQSFQANDIAEAESQGTEADVFNTANVFNEATVPEGAGHALSALPVCGPCSTRLCHTLNKLEEDLDIGNEQACQRAIDSTIRDALGSLNHTCGQAFAMNMVHAFSEWPRAAFIGIATNAVISTWSTTALRKRGFSKKLAKAGTREVMRHIVTKPDGSLPSWCEE
jgi:hypothetical protein